MKFELDIDGEKVVMNEDDLLIKDASSEAPSASAAIFYWGSVVAALRAKLETAKADYRRLAATARIDSLAREPKLAEWKVAAAFEASDIFRTAKGVIAHWQRLYDQAQAVYAACQSRASIIQTIYNYESNGRSFSSSLGDEKETKTQKVRQIMRKKR